MTIRHLYTSPGHNFVGHHDLPPGDSPTLEPAEIEVIAGQGIMGDRYFGWRDDYKGQVTFFSWETYVAVCQQLGVSDRAASVFRRNIVVEGVDLNALIGREFTVQGVSFLGTQEAAPCYWMEQAFGVGAEAALRGRGGLRAKVLTDGVLRLDPVPQTVVAASV
jgi:hypothetical protein